MHDYLVVNCRRDDYFLFIYWNCMIYCLIRNRASHLALQKTRRVKQQLIQMDLKALDVCSLKSVDKVQLYEVYNHYLHYSVCVSATGEE